MKIKDITNVLEQWAPRSYQEGYDNSGLIIGDAGAEVSQVLISLDVTEEVIEEAIMENCQLIVAHHPLIFSGLKKVTTDHWVERCVTAAIKNDIAIYAIHTNLDNVLTGVNRRIAERLNLVNCSILSPKNDTLVKLVSYAPSDDAEQVLEALHDAGAGNIGEYAECAFTLEGTGSFKPSESANPSIGKVGNREFVKETRIEVIVPEHKQSAVLSALKAVHPYEEVAYYRIPLLNSNQGVGSGMIGELKEPESPDSFISFLKERMNLKIVKHTALTKKEIKRVAVCGGAGVFLLSKAVQAGADVFVTSDVKYHDFFEADSRIILADIGHYESEIFTKDLIHDFLTQKFANIAFRLTGVVTNPVKIS